MEVMCPGVILKYIKQFLYFDVAIDKLYKRGQRLNFFFQAEDGIRDHA